MFAPNIAYALTGGPASPDYTSFEPVDTSDMVSLISGDLAYNIPLLEVPGPAGGFPLSLSYHAGIMPNEEASWVGLGWTLNPGAINRSVNGFADDHKNVEHSDRFFWEGGVQQSATVGISLGISGVSSISAGLEIGTDTYQGFGVGSFIGANIGVGGEKSPVSVGFNLGVDPWGNPYASGSVGLSGSVGGSGSAVKLGGQVGATTNFKSVAGYGSARASLGGLVTGSISASGSGIKPSLSVGGASARIDNGKAGQISTSGHSLTLPLPYVHLGYKYQRYWSDETEDVETSGAMYFPRTAVDRIHLDTHDYDTYTLLDLDEPGGVVENDNPERVMGGSFPQFDDYNVVAQGVTGSIRPHIYQQHLLRRNVKIDGEYDILHYPTGFTPLASTSTYNPNGTKVDFRFENEFSNRFLYDPNSNMAPNVSGKPVFYQFDNPNIATDDPITGESDSNGAGDYLDGFLNGSARPIEYYTNAEIELGVTGFIDNNATGFDRATLKPDQTGAFVITNETGVSYHFTLPARAYDEYQYSENIEKGEGHTFNEYKNPEEYAYMWHLTAITGPDFVDRGVVGVLDEADWGYWVEFDYGKWTDQYFWRNPGEGMNMDLDNNFQNIAEGTKEIYYLDAVRTKTHTALFVKDVREDALSSLKFFRNLTGNGQLKTNPTNPLTQDNRNGGFQPKDLTSIYQVGSVDYSVLNYHAKPTHSMRLDKVYLIENTDLAGLNEQKSDGSWPEFSSQTVNWSNTYGGLLEPYTFNQHQADNVFDVRDINAANLAAKSLRVIDLENDNYDLVPNTPNSSAGKLTLKGVDFLGKEGIKTIPTMKFNYGVAESFLDGEITKSSLADLNGNSAANTIETGTDALEEGDMIEVSSSMGKSYYTVDWKISSTKYGINPVFNSLGIAGGKVDVEFRKANNNPPYEKDHFDLWGMYKSDYEEDASKNENVKRLVSPTSAQKVDVWSLREIETSIGATIEIEYESDSYRKPATYVNQILPIKTIYDDRVYLHDGGPEITEFFKPGMNINLTYVYYKGTGIHGSWANTKEWLLGDHTVEILNVVDDGTDRYLEVNQTVMPINTTSPVGFTAVYYFKGGNISMTDDFNQQGGGLRVSKVSTTSLSEKLSTTYDYNLTNNTSSGVTSFEPFGANVVELPELNGVDNLSTPLQDAYEEKVKEYKDSLQSKLFDIINLATEIPAPGVLYEQVTVKESVEDENGERFLPTYTVYEFESFQPSMLGVNKSITGQQTFPQTIHDPDYNLTPYGETRISAIELKDYSSRVGSLKSTSVYNDQDQLLTKVQNHYLHDQLPVGGSEQDRFEDNMDIYEDLLHTRFFDQGVIEETYADARYVKREDGFFDLLALTSQREKYPSIQTGSTTTNYKTGITTTTRNLAFDFYSGQVTETYSEDAYGNKFAVRSTPAYRDNPGMSAKNMLLQEGGTYTYLLDPAFDPDTYVSVKDPNHVLFPSIEREATGLVSATYQSWIGGGNVLEGNTLQAYSDVFRKHKFYQNEGSGSLNQDGTQSWTYTDNFEPGGTVPNPSQGWEEVSAITLYDVNSHALEASDINGNFAATRFDAKNESVLATVANAAYEEFNYSGFENAEDGGFTFSGIFTGPNSTHAHTGAKSMKIASSGEAYFTILDDEHVANEPYSISFWSYHEFGSAATLYYKVDSGLEVPISYTSTDEKSVVIDGNKWYLNRVDFIPPDSFTQLEIGLKKASGVAWIDDFRFQPADATMTSYVYNTWGELSDILDANNLFTHYEYDPSGKLLSMTRETFEHDLVLTSSVDIHYGKQPGNNALMGLINDSQVDHNTVNLSIDFSSVGSGNYETTWTIDGVATTSAGVDKVVNLTSSGYKEVIAEVSDLDNNLSFTDYRKIYMRVSSTSGTLLNSYCQMNGECYTAFRVNIYADGNNGTYQEIVADPTCLDLNAGNSNCEL